MTGEKPLSKTTNRVLFSPVTTHNHKIKSEHTAWASSASTLPPSAEAALLSLSPVDDTHALDKPLRFKRQIV